MHLRSHTHLLGLLCLCLATGPVLADGRVQVHFSGTLYPDASAIDLRLAREDLEADYEGEPDPVALRLRRIGIAFHERLAPSVRAGMALGRAGFTQSGRSATEGLDPVGYFAELGFEGAWPAQSRIQALLAATWRYTSLEDAEADAEVEVAWHTLELRPGIRLAVAPRLAVRAGATFGAIDGSERVTAPVRRTTGFDIDEPGAGFLTLEYLPSANDVVALRLRGGNPEGLRLVFEHRY